MVLLVGSCGAVLGSPSSVAPSPSSPAGSPAQPGTTYHDPSASTTQRFDDGAIAFDFPSSWYGRKGTVNPSGNRAIVFVSPDELPSDCTENAQGGVCYGWPVTTLPPNGIVMAWRSYGMPGSRPPSTGDPITVGGRAARLDRGPASQGCAAIGGDESIAVVVTPSAEEAGWMGIDGCLSGPDHPAGEAAFTAILASATLP